jgi:hypothetical protein
VALPKICEEKLSAVLPYDFLNFTFTPSTSCAIKSREGEACEQRLKFTWYMSSPRADNCSSVLPAANNVLKVCRPEIIRMSRVKLMKIFYCINSSVEGQKK